MTLFSHLLERDTSIHLSPYSTEGNSHNGQGQGNSHQVSVPQTVLSSSVETQSAPHREFNDLVNMSAKELEEWLEGEQSQGSGWSKGDGSDETVGHERYDLSWTCIALSIVQREF